MQIVTIGPQLTLSPNLCFTMLFNQTDIPKVPLPVGESTPREIHVPWIHPTKHPKLHFNPFCHFCTDYGRESLFFTMSVSN